ncbi:MAG: Asp-tRNA(Asn)/Glu-tRNA(Gln) amidotransferase subunit GatC [Anaerolineales bacterium]|jgi:aspartyl-tRNA(Asn)/glutamyl-tRNA(Gln) amidotransferase subunit C
MSLTNEEVQHIANLARMNLSEDELELYRKQLSAILDYFKQLEALDTDDIPPTANVSVDQNPLRVDQPDSSLSPEELLQNAPEKDDHLFRVPPIFE